MWNHDFSKNPELTNSQLDSLGLLSPFPQIVDDFVAEVVKVHDGDTVTLRTSFRDFDFPLRLANIDAPELSEGGQEAKEYLEGLALGKEVMVLIDSENRVGKYGRLIGELLVSGFNAGEDMLRQGLVFEFGQKNANKIKDFSHLLREVAYE